MTEKRSEGAPSEEELVRALTELKGKATVEGIMGLFKAKGHTFDKTKTWDRLVILSRKGKLKNDSGAWVLLNYQGGPLS